METKLFKKSFMKVVPYVTNFIGTIFLLILYSLKLNPQYYGDATIWSNAFTHYVFVIYFLGFFVELILLGLSVYFSLIRKKKNSICLYISTIFNIVFSFAVFILCFVNKMFTSVSMAMSILSIIFTLLGAIYIVVDLPKKEYETTDAKPINKIVLLILSSIALLFSLLIFAFPLFTYSVSGEETINYFLLSSLNAETVYLPLYISFIAFFILSFVAIMQFIMSFKYFYQGGKAYLEQTKGIVFYNFFITVAYFLTGFILSFVLNIRDPHYSTIAYVPLIFMVIIFLVYYIFVGKYTAEETDSLPKEAKKKQIKNFEGVLYICLLTLITVLTLFVKIIKIHFANDSYMANISVTGLELLQRYWSLSSGMQLMSFVEFLFLLTSGLVLLMVLVSYFGKVRNFKKVLQVGAIVNVFLMFLYGISGMYFAIGQKINEANILSIIEIYGGTVSGDIKYVYTVSTDTIYLLGASILVTVWMVLRGYFSVKDKELLPESVALNADEKAKESLADIKEDKPLPIEEKKEDNKITTEDAQADYDVCPAFTEIDSNLQEFTLSYERRLSNSFTSPTLKSLTEFIVDYARNSRLHLSYTVEDIATFIAGLGASRLSILQGMSGTGKTSLPKIFIEAIMGNCEIIEVESSWRDKNELLGYYNEFSKSYTPKKFTQSLYRATLNPDVPTLIVLDEMNLSRIEYYFSDFLSLMENEEDKREIKLLNVKLYRIENSEKKEYLGLSNGHTIKIPKNVWFIGTANRDESTFEISDKVYDRAQTMNFNKRAQKVRSFQPPMEQRFLSYSNFASLLAEAKKETTFDIESDRRVQEAERLLSPYNISFGNRVLNQMEEFIKIYCACLKDKPNVTQEAVERILLSKVVSKLEYKNVDDKESLAQEFDNISLPLCSAFIRKLNED